MCLKLINKVITKLVRLDSMIFNTLGTFNSFLRNKIVMY